MLWIFPKSASNYAYFEFYYIIWALLTKFWSIKGLDTFRVLDHKIVKFIAAYKAYDFETAMAAYYQSSEKQGDFFVFNFMHLIQRCFICRLSDSTVSEDAGIEPAGLSRLFLHWLPDALTNWLDLIHTRLDLIHTRLDLIPTRLDLIHTSARSHQYSAKSHPWGTTYRYTSMKFFWLFCRNRILMVPRACNSRFLKIVFDSAKIFDF